MGNLKFSFEYAFCHVPLDGALAVIVEAVLVTVANPLNVKLFKSVHDLDSVKSGIPSLSSSTSTISGTPSASVSKQALIFALLA